MSRLSPPLALALLLVLAAGSAADEDEAPAGPSRTWVGITGLDALDPASRSPALLAAMEGLPPLLVETRPIAWGAIEGHPPVLDGRALRDYETLDAFVLGWLEAGHHPVLVLSPRSGWAATPAAEAAVVREVRGWEAGPAAEAWLAGPLGPTPPAARRWEAWEAFVQATVERYDGDGQDDAPGLAGAVRHVRVLSDAADPAAWAGSAAEYLRLLHHASLGAAKASPATVVIHGGIDIAGLGHAPRPDDEAGLLARVAGRDLPALARRLERFRVERALRVLDVPRLVGAVPHAGSPSLVDEASDLAWLAAHLGRLAEVPPAVWLAPSPLPKLDAPDVPGAAVPDAEERGRRVRLVAAARRGEAEAASALAEGTAFDLVRTLVSARAAGASTVLLAGPASGRGRPPATGLDALVAPGRDVALARQPAAWALAQLLALTGGLGAVEELAAGRGVRAVRFTGGGDAFLVVLWRDPRLGWAPGSGTPAPTTLRLAPGRYRLVPVATGGEADAEGSVIHAPEGVVRVALGAAPHYLVPLP